MYLIKFLIFLVYFTKACNSLWKCSSYWVPFEGETEEKSVKKVFMDLSRCREFSMDWLYVGLITNSGVYEIELCAVGSIYYRYFGTNNEDGPPKLNDVIHNLFNLEHFKDFKKDATIDDSKLNYGTLHKRRHYNIIAGNHNKFPTNRLLFQRNATCATVLYDEKIMTYSLVVEPIIRIPNQKCKPIARFEKLRLGKVNVIESTWYDYGSPNSGKAHLSVRFEYGVEINGTNEFIYPSENTTQVKALLSHLKSLVKFDEIDTSNLNISIPYNWKQDFEWRIIGKDRINFQKFVDSIDGGDIEIYQLVADCGNLTLLTKYFATGVYLHGKCIGGLVPEDMHVERGNCIVIKTK